MFRFIVVSAIMASVMAFAPSAMRSSRSALRMNVAEELSGATAPFGFFDPLGYSTRASSAEILKFREAEIKHGRVAMLAALGILVGEEVEFGTPLYGDKIVGPAIYQFQEADQLTGYAFGFGIVALIALIEFSTINIGWESVEQKTARDPENKTGAQLAPGYSPGNLGFDPLGLGKNLDAAAFKEIQTKEINNGRLAMIATAGMLVQELVNGKGVLENLGLESALPKAFDTATF